jgi:hypothetical protein
LEETTLRRLAKDEFFLPKTAHQLVVQLDTATKMLETLTVTNGVAVDGLKKALKFLKRNSQAISQQLTTDSNLAIKIVYLLDRELQRFFPILGDAAEDMSLMDEDKTTNAICTTPSKPGCPISKEDESQLSFSLRSSEESHPIPKHDVHSKTIGTPAPSGSMNLSQ